MSSVISFVPSDFKVGASYYAEFSLNGSVEYTVNNLVENQRVDFNVVIPGTYIINVKEVGNGACVASHIVQALFPQVSVSTTGVNCSNNTYTYNLFLLNTETAGTNVQYGWSLLNDCNTVTNWSLTTSLIIPADDALRYVFVKNDDVSCCNFLSSTVKSPCITCRLSVNNVVFSCNG